MVANFNDRVDPSCVWDALFLTAGGDLLMKQPGIVGLHTVTSTQRIGVQVIRNDRR